MFKPDFGKKFFEEHQASLVSFANTRLGRWFFQITEIPSSKRIVQIGTNFLRYDCKAIVGPDGEPWIEMKTMLLSRQHYQRRLLLAFERFRRLVPLTAISWLLKPSNGFAFASVLPFIALTTTTVNPASGANSPVDGITKRNGVAETWSTIRNGAGTASSATDTNEQIILRSTTVLNTWTALTRGIFLFDASAIDDTDIISAAVFSLYATGKNTGISGCEWGLYASTPAANNAIANADFSQLGTTEFATAIAAGSITTSAYNDWTLNATGIAAISKTGITKFGVREKNYDANNTTATWSSDTQTDMSVNFADSASNKPKLVITHAAPATGFKNLLLLGVG